MTSCKTAFPQFSQKENQMTQLLKPSVTPGSKKKVKGGTMTLCKLDTPNFLKPCVHTKVRLFPNTSELSLRN